jgi:SAM-dependent methyltransferase
MAEVSPQSAPGAAPAGLDGLPALASMLRCLRCGAALTGDGAEAARCTGCAAIYPVASGTVRMLAGEDAPAAERALKAATAESFAYEWEHFGGTREEWDRNFRDYVRPFEPAWFAGRLVLDAGAGSGRHSREAARQGARVVATDLGDAIHVARRNLPADVLTVQADVEDLPFEEGAFDMVMSIGVLHHLPDPERGLRRIARHVRPGGHLHVYLYWWPEIAWHRTVLRWIQAVRRVTTRMPHRVLHLLCYPLAALLFAAFVLPYRLLRHRRATAWLARRLPLKTYADYPFGVCVNDQFDRLSAPIEHRFTADEVRTLLERAGFVDVVVLPHHGWIGSARRPEAAG